MQRATQSRPRPDLGCVAMMVQAAKSGKTARQVRSHLKSCGFSGDEIAWAADYLSKSDQEEQKDE